MAAFTYKAVTKDGKRVDGTVQAASRSEAMAAVRKRSSAARPRT